MGSAIFVHDGATVTTSSVTFQDNTAATSEANIYVFGTGELIEQ